MINLIESMLPAPLQFLVTYLTLYAESTPPTLPTNSELSLPLQLINVSGCANEQ
jgi:hypothetical protein